MSEHSHDHPWFLGHHWQGAKQQFEAGKLGMWLFLATEVLFFGGLFCAYALWRGNHPELFKFGSEYLDTKWGAINTAVLIASSMTMAMAVTFAQQNRQGLLKLCLALTLLGAFGFLGIKYIEYSHKFHMGIYPGMKLYGNEYVRTEAQQLAGHGEEIGATAGPIGSGTAVREEPFALPEAEAPMISLPATAPTGINPSVLEHGKLSSGSNAGEGVPHHAARHVHSGDPPHPVFRDTRPEAAHMFFNIYFMMTGLHGIHVVVGVIVILWLLIRAMKGQFNDKYFTPVDLGGLYWHLVDLIWIFLFPMFYLI